MPDSPIDPNLIFNYRLSRLVTQISAPVVRLCEGRFGITRREWRFLSMLARDGALSPSALADRAGLDRARVSRVIGSMSDKGLVERQPRPSDRRQAIVQLTARGLSLVQELFPLVAEINARALQGLSPQQRQQLDELIELLTRQTADFNRELVTEYHANRRAGRARRPHWPEESGKGG
jgi:DNA-binding MarR family transcriptional regulator